MPFVSITPPPGVIKPGTVYDAKGRWYDTKWVRWFEGVMQAIKGFEAVEVSGAQIDATERVSGTHSWNNNSGAPLLAWGGPTLIKVLKGGSVFDVTPSAGFTAGVADAVITTGNYGNGDYGDGLYGTGDTVITDLQEAQSYQMDNYGEDLFFVAHADGQLWYMDQDGDSGDPLEAALITATTGSTPTSNLGVVVTPERFVFCLGAGGDGRKIQWPDVDDYTDWLAATTNQAGDIDLPGKGSIMAGMRAQAETLVWTDQDLFAVRYIGGSFIYQAVPVGAVGAISRRAMGVVGSVAYWMSPRGFQIYNGYTQAIDSPLGDYVFDDINLNQASKVWCEVRSEFGEVTWHYPSGGSTECDRSVTYNFNDGFWFNNAVERTAGEDRGALQYPTAFDADGLLYRHEIGSNYGNATPAVGSGATSGTSGWTDFSEFPVAAALPSGLSYVGDASPPTLGIGNDATEGNYFYLTSDTFSEFAMTVDAFDTAIADLDGDLEMLGRIWLPAQVTNRRIGGPAAFIGGTTDADVDMVSGDIYYRTAGSDHEAMLIETINGTGGVLANADMQEAETDEVWAWVRWRVTDEGATDNYYIKVWTGAIADEPASWDATALAASPRNASLGTKIGWGIASLSIAAEARIAFISFTTSPDTESPPNDEEGTATVTAAVPNVPEAVSGPIEIGKGDNVMHVQSLIPDEKTLGDVDLYLITSFYPTADETTNGPYTPANPTDVRLIARQMRLKVVEDQPNWRIGTIRADVELGGRR